VTHPTSHQHNPYHFFYTPIKTNNHHGSVNDGSDLLGMQSCLAFLSLFQFAHVPQLNQWVLDWEGNLARIKESIHIAKERGATLRVG
jgi:hypothetical protein